MRPRYICLVISTSSHKLPLMRPVSKPDVKTNGSSFWGVLGLNEGVASSITSSTKPDSTISNLGGATPSPVSCDAVVKPFNNLAIDEAMWSRSRLKAAVLSLFVDEEQISFSCLWWPNADLNHASYASWTS